MIEKVAANTYDKVTGSPKFREWFSGSKVVDRSGRPKVLYHATYSDFSEFEPGKGQFGNHFGSLAAAEHRAAALRSRFGGVQIRYIPVFLSIKNPIQVKDVIEFDAPKMIIHGLMTSPSLSAEEKETISRLQKPSMDVLRNEILKLGFNGFVYRNREEDKGSDSYITINKGQVWNLYSNARM